MRIPSLRLLTGMLMLAAILMVWTQSVQSTVVPVEQAIEADTHNVNLPRRPDGMLSVRRCNGCRAELLHVSAATRYMLGPSTFVSQKQFLEKLREASMRDGMLVVFYTPDDKLVTRVRLILRP